MPNAQACLGLLPSTGQNLRTTRLAGHTRHLCGTAGTLKRPAAEAVGELES
jgi:hypothetical protein